MLTNVININKCAYELRMINFTIGRMIAEQYPPQLYLQVQDWNVVRDTTCSGHFLR